MILLGTVESAAGVVEPIRKKTIRNFVKLLHKVVGKRWVSLQENYVGLFFVNSRNAVSELGVSLEYVQRYGNYIIR